MKIWQLIPLVICLSGCGITASGRNPGFASFDIPAQLGLKRDTTLSLGPAVLRIAARHMDDDPQTAALLKAMDGVQLGIYRVSRGSSLQALNDQVELTALAMADDEWQRIVRVVEEDQNVHVLVKQDVQAILGITVLVVDPEELVFVNVMGELDQELLASLAEADPTRDGFSFGPSLRSTLDASLGSLSFR